MLCYVRLSWVVVELGFWQWLVVVSQAPEPEHLRVPSTKKFWLLICQNLGAGAWRLYIWLGSQSEVEFTGKFPLKKLLYEQIWPKKRKNKENNIHKQKMGYFTERRIWLGCKKTIAKVLGIVWWMNKKKLRLFKRYLEFCSLKKIKGNLSAVQLTEKNSIKKNSWAT